MSSREAILNAIKSINMESIEMPVLPEFQVWFDDVLHHFKETVTNIGAQVYEAEDEASIPYIIKTNFSLEGRVISNLPQLSSIAEILTQQDVPQLYEDVEFAILKGTLGVAENGAIWLDESMMSVRVLPFICQQLILIVSKKDIVPLMKDAYDAIGSQEYGYGAFIAGPSKTADIEQSLVLGAHGACGLGVILI